MNVINSQMLQSKKMVTDNNIHVFQTGPTTYGLSIGNLFFQCAVGKNGIGNKQREGDGITPIGDFPIRFGFYRSDRVKSSPITVEGVCMMESNKTIGWCDDPSDPIHYNRLVALPFPYSSEQIWREDDLYNVVLVLGYNDDPVVVGRGSAIFMHVAKEGYGPTAGCVSLKLQDLLKVLSMVTCDTIVSIRP